MRNSICLFHLSGIPIDVSYRDDVLFVDNWLVKSQEGDVILECGRVVRLVDCLAPDLVVLVRQPLALVSHVPLTKANLNFQEIKHQLKIMFTFMAEMAVEKTQCAAVTTHSSEMRAPPQEILLLRKLCLTSAALQG